MSRIADLAGRALCEAELIAIVAIAVLISIAG